MLGTHRSRAAGGSIRGLAQPGHCGVPRPALSGVPRAVQAPLCAAGTVNPRQEPCLGRGKLWGAAFQLGSLTLPKLCSGSRAFCLTPPG